MDASRFDTIVRSFRSRRGALRAAAGFGAALVAPRVARGAHPNCRLTGEKCHHGDASACCSGVCKKHKGKSRCVPAGSAQGCTKILDACLANHLHPCPQNPGGFCIGGEQGKPLCASGISTACAVCQTDADCITEFGLTARCIQGCAFCAGATACAVPIPPA